MRLFVPTPDELKQIKAGALKAFIRPIEPQPIQQDELHGKPLWYWKTKKVKRGYIHRLEDSLVQWLGKCSPHQPGNVLAVIEDWWIGPWYLEVKFASYHLIVTDVQSVRTTDLTARDIEDLRSSREYTRPYAAVHVNWNTTYPDLPFEKGPWLWFYQCELEGEK